MFRQHWFASALLATCLIPNAQAATEPDPSGASFRDPTEGNWYHPIEPDSWAHVGAEPAVIEEVLSRIATAEGIRRHPEQPDTLVNYGPGHWIYEWSQAGDQAQMLAKAAEQNGDQDSAKRLYLAATSYYLRASSPHTDEPANLAALQQAQINYRQAGRYLPVPLQVVEIPFAGQHFKGNLHLPQGNGPFPLIVMSFGSDVAKEEGMPFFEKQLAPRGIALLMIDMPGMGDSRAWRITADIDKLHSAAVNYSRTLANIDGKNIFVMGASFGGTPVARMLLARPELDLAGLVYICGPIHRPFMAPADTLEQFPAFTMDGVRTRLGLPPDAPASAISAKLQPLSLLQQGLLNPQQPQPRSTPLLILSTNADPVAPLADIDLLQQHSQRSKRLIYDVPGHCPDRDSREAIAASWVQDQLRSN